MAARITLVACLVAALTLARPRLLQKVPWSPAFCGHEFRKVRRPDRGRHRLAAVTLDRTAALERLGLDTNGNVEPSPKILKQAFRKLALKWHPDQAGGDVSRYEEVREAYELLMGLPPSVGPATMPANFTWEDVTQDEVQDALWSLPSAVVALYGGPRRFALLNIPIALFSLVTNQFGMTEALLAQEGLKPTVRDFRLDGLYPVNGLKRHYVDPPLSCTFQYPQDFVYDKALEFARIQQSQLGARLPLVTLVSPQGFDSFTVSWSLQSRSAPGLRVALYAIPNKRGESLSKALTPDLFQVLLAQLLAAGSVLAPPMVQFRKPRVEQLSSELTSTAGVDRMYSEWQALCSENKTKDVSIFATAQLCSVADGTSLKTGLMESMSISNTGRKVQGSTVDSKTYNVNTKQNSYILLLLGLAPATVSDTDRERARKAAQSFEFL